MQASLTALIHNKFVDFIMKDDIQNHIAELESHFNFLDSMDVHIDDSMRVA